MLLKLFFIVQVQCCYRLLVLNPVFFYNDFLAKKPQNISFFFLFLGFSIFINSHIIILNLFNYLANLITCVLYKIWFYYLRSYIVANGQNDRIFGFVFTIVWLGSNPGRGEKSCTTGESHWSHPICHDDRCGKAAVSHLHCGRREHVCSGVINFLNMCPTAFLRLIDVFVFH